jgi:drug/metabolite transporter (DMT)-like permease
MSKNKPKEKHVECNGRPILGVFLILLHALSIAVMYILIKDLTHHLSPFQVAFLYKITLFVMILPWCLWGGHKKNLKTKKLGMHLARGAFSFLGTLCFIIAISNLTTTDATAISYLEHILVIVIGVLYFKEKVDHAKIIMIVLSFVGALFVIKPGIVIFNKYYIFLFLALGFWAMNCTVIKILGATERSKAQIFYMTLFSGILSLPMALYEWRPTELWQSKYVVGIALVYLIHSVAFFKALRYGNISTIMPFDYSRLIFTGILSYLLLGEVPDYYSISGYVMIALGGIYLIYHEYGKLKSRKPAKSKNVEEKGYEYDRI